MTREAQEQHLEDTELVRGMAAGEERCLGALYDRHAGSLMAIGLHMLRDHAAAEDVVHDVMLEAYRKAGTFDPTRGSARGWLLVRMRSRCLDRVRANAVRRDLTEHDAPAPTAPPAPDATTQDHALLHTAIAELPEAQRVVLQHLYFSEMSTTEIAAAIGCPVGTVKSRVRLAMVSLRTALAAQEVG